jgi:hypothetical protein
MKMPKFFLRDLLGKILRKRAALPVLSPNARKSLSARDRVRSGIEPLEGRIAPAILLNASTLSYTDTDGDLVTVKFSKNIFQFGAAGIDAELAKVFKFDNGTAHVAATVDAPQQLRLIDLSAATATGSILGNLNGVSFSVTAEVGGLNGVPGDGFAKVGAIKSGTRALGVVTIDGDLGQIDVASAASVIGLVQLKAQSIGKYGLTTQAPLDAATSTPAPDLESKISGKLLRLIVNEDMGGYIHAVDSSVQRGTIGSVVIGGALRDIVTDDSAADNMGRIESSYDIGTVIVGSIAGGAGKKTGSINAAHLITRVTVTNDVTGGAGEDSGTIVSFGSMNRVAIGGDLTGAVGLRSGSVRTGGNMGFVTIGTALPGSGDVTGGTGDSSGLIFSGGSINATKIFGSILGVGARSGGVFASGNLASITVLGSLTGAATTSSGAIESVGDSGSIFIGGNVTGSDGAGSGAIIVGGKLARATIGGQLDGGKGANSGALLAGHDPSRASHDLGPVTIGGALLGDEGAGSGSIVSGGKIGVVRIGATLQSGVAMDGGSGAISGAIFAGGTIQSVTLSRGVLGDTGSGSASIQSHGALGSVFIGGDLAGGTGSESASILSHENTTAARPIAGSIGRVIVTGKLDGLGDHTALIQADGALGLVRAGAIEGGTGSYSGAIVSGAGLVRPGPTAAITVTGPISGGTGDHSGYIEIDGRLGALTAGGLSGATIHVANDLGALTVNGSAVDSFITARGQALHGQTTNVAIGGVNVTGDVTNTRIFAGYDVLGAAVNPDAQIGVVRVSGNWTASTLVAGTTAGFDGLFGTDDDAFAEGPNRASIVSRIARVIIGGGVAGTAPDGDHFGFIAQQIGAFSSSAGALALTAAPHQVFEIGTDVTVREVAQVV